MAIRAGDALHWMRRAFVRIKMRYALLRVLAVNQSALD
jgi:hypothetical protein